MAEEEASVGSTLSTYSLFSFLHHANVPLTDRDPWRLKQIISILIQCLPGFANLLPSPNPVFHRDIKPDIILVVDREREVESQEAGPRIKLAVFDLAVQGVDRGGLASTFSYVAPEAFSN